MQHPARQLEIEKQLLALFSVPKAILVLDMSGFSRTTRMYGIVTFLLMLHQTRKLCDPCIRRHGGILVKAEADNLFCLFEQPAQAVAAAREIIASMNTANCLLPDSRQLRASIGIGFGETLYIGDEDLFGDEVNLASKLGEDIAAASEILVTTEAFARLPNEMETATKASVSVSGLTLDYWKMRL